MCKSILVAAASAVTVILSAVAVTVAASAVSTAMASAAASATVASAAAISVDILSVKALCEFLLSRFADCEDLSCEVEGLACHLVVPCLARFHSLIQRVM